MKGQGLNETQLHDLAQFQIRNPMFNPEFEDNTYGKGMLAMMASFAAGRNGITQGEADAWFAESGELSNAGRFFFSLNRHKFVADQPATA